MHAPWPVSMGGTVIFSSAVTVSSHSLVGYSGGSGCCRGGSSGGREQAPIGSRSRTNRFVLVLAVEDLVEVPDAGQAGMESAGVPHRHRVAGLSRLPDGRRL